MSKIYRLAALRRSKRSGARSFSETAEPSSLAISYLRAENIG
jgi:hypothetical protein